jgi:CO/xanthine dehydrogenase Mo-binding subunit
MSETTEMGGPERAPQSPRARRAPAKPWRSSILRQDPSRAGAFSRRGFLQTTGALIIGFSLAPGLTAAQDKARLPGSLNTNRMLGAWLAIAPNGRVTIFTGKIELGQGIGTALAQIAADELDVDLARIDVISGDTARTPTRARPRAACRWSRAARPCASPARRRDTCSSPPLPPSSVRRPPS